MRHHNKFIESIFVDVLEQSEQEEQEKDDLAIALDELLGQIFDMEEN